LTKLRCLHRLDRQLTTGRSPVHLPFQPRIERSRCELFQNVTGFLAQTPGSSRGRIRIVSTSRHFSTGRCYSALAKLRNTSRSDRTARFLPAERFRRTQDLPFAKKCQEKLVR
jgi:hypothetical protein